MTQAAGGLRASPVDPLDTVLANVQDPGRLDQTAERLKKSGLVSGAGNSLAETVFPDELVSLSSTGSVCGAPCYISRIRCTSGTSVALTLWEGAAGAATTLFTATLSAGQEATIPNNKIRAINGVRAVFASGTFDFYIGKEA